MRGAAEVAMVVGAALTVLVGVSEAQRLAADVGYTGWQTWAYALMVQLPLLAGTARAISIANGDRVVHRLEIWGWLAWVVLFTLGSDVLAGLETGAAGAIVPGALTVLMLATWPLPFAMSRARG